MRWGDWPSGRAARWRRALVVTGGDSRGDPCEAFAYHGFNGMEAAVVQKIAAWITGR